MQKIAPGNDPEHPILVMLAHDGDNAFGGGYSYYEQVCEGCGLASVFLSLN